MIEWIVAAVLVPLVVRETGEVAPWAAGGMVRWSARRMRTQTARDRYTEEWIANLACVPGSLTKLGYAFQIVAVAAPRLRRQQLRELRRIDAMHARAEGAIATLRTASGLPETYTAVVEGAVSGVGFRSVLLNIPQPGGRIMGVAGAGNVAMISAVVGTSGRREEYERFLAKGESWGSLKFMVGDPDDPVDLPEFTPNLPHSTDPDHWAPGYGLIAPLQTPHGDLVGWLAVDEPESGSIPDAVQRELLEKYAAHAAIAIANVREQ
jgi:hypothetical protein